MIKTFTIFFHKYADLVSNFGCTCNLPMKQEISHPTFYRKRVNKAQKFKQNPQIQNLKIHLNKLVHKGYCHSIITKSFNMVFIGTNIDFLINSLIRN